MRCRITSLYEAGVQLVVFVVATTKSADGTKASHENFVKVALHLVLTIDHTFQRANELF